MLISSHSQGPPDLGPGRVIVVPRPMTARSAASDVISTSSPSKGESTGDEAAERLRLLAIKRAQIAAGARIEVGREVCPAW